MHPVETLELVLGMLLAILVLHWIAERLNWPPSIALLTGGGAIAFLPGVPSIHLDPELVLVLFLPPLLMDGAWYTAIVQFRRHFIGILSLAIGAVVFTTLVVACVAHWLFPMMPWAACAALGAILSPPDAISARAVLQRVRLPRRVSTLLEGESLLNDAAGLVLFRFAVAAAMGEAFNPIAAIGQFVILTLGGILTGVAIGMLWTAMAARLRDELLLVVSSALVGWIAYLLGEAIHVSGVIATVTMGLVLGWRQHVILSAGVRLRATSFWQVLVFLFEASVLMLIGFSLREVLERAGGFDAVLSHMAWPLAAIVAALTVARFIWMFGSDGAVRLLRALGWTESPPIGAPAAIVMGWAGMRGVVTLAVALTVPETMPGHDQMIVIAFGVILVTVLVQGSTLGLLIRWTGIRPSVGEAPPLDLFAAETAVARAQLTMVETLARDADGMVIHPRLLDQFTRRVLVAETFTGTEEERSADIAAHYDVIIAAVGAGRAELVHLHRTHMIDDETLHSLEHDLDLEELSAASAKG